MIRVVNKYTHVRTDNEIVVSVMRGSDLGNPFHMHDKSDAERNRVCDLYIGWLRNQYTIVDSPARRELERLADIAYAGDLALQCCCAPMRCHAETVKAAIEGIIRLRNR